MNDPVTGFEPIGLGLSPNDGLGDTPRLAGAKINRMLAELFTSIDDIRAMVAAGGAPGTDTPPPAPTFIQAPSITTDGSPTAGEMLLLVDGVVSNGSITARTLFRNGVSLGAVAAGNYIAQLPGDYIYRNAAGSTASNSGSVTVAPAPVAPTPTPATPTPTPAPVPSYSVATPASIAEGDSGTKNLGFLITRDIGTAAGSVHYATGDITAVAGVDYIATSGTLEFAQGETSKTVNVPIIGNTAHQSNRIFSLTISSPQPAGTITTATGTGTIVDDDAAPAFFPENANYGMFAGLQRFLASWTGALAYACSLAQADGTPAGGDTVAIPYGNDNKPDYTAAKAAFGNLFAVWQLQDQSGHGHHPVQLTAANRMVVDATIAGRETFLSAQSSTDQSPGNVTAWFEVPQSLVTSRTNSAMFALVSGSNGNQGSNSHSIMALGQNDVEDGASLLLNPSRTDSGGLMLRSSNEQFSTLPIDSYGVTLAGAVFTPSAQRFVRDADVVSKPAASSVQMLGGKLGIGVFNVAQTEIIRSSGWIVMTAAPDDATLAALATATRAVFPVGNRDTQFVRDADSFGWGYGATLARNEDFYLRAQLAHPAYLYNLGMGGIQAANLVNYRPQEWFDAHYRADLAHNNYMLAIGINDVASNRSTADVTADLATLVGRAKAAGFKPFVALLLPFALGGAMEQVRNEVNQWILDNAAALGFVAVDRRGINPQYDNSNHPNSAGYATIAANDAGPMNQYGFAA